MIIVHRCQQRQESLKSVTQVNSLSPVSLTPAINIYLQISPDFSKKFETAPIEYSGARRTHWFMKKTVVGNSRFRLPLRSHKTVKIKVSLNFYCLLMEGFGAEPGSDAEPDPGSPQTYASYESGSATLFQTKQTFFSDLTFGKIIKHKRRDKK